MAFSEGMSDAFGGCLVLFLYPLCCWALYEYVYLISYGLGMRSA